jgi:hypothetical protein
VPATATAAAAVAAAAAAADADPALQKAEPTLFEPVNRIGKLRATRPKGRP